jgi:hypothetical protein
MAVITAGGLTPTVAVVQGQMPKQITDNPQDIPLDGTPTELLFLRMEAENWGI